MSAPIDLPKWADTLLVPAVSVVSAFLVAGLVVVGIGENPLTATRWLIQGALGSGERAAAPWPPGLHRGDRRAARRLSHAARTCWAGRG